MIIINVKFAEMNTSYDFKVDETEKVSQLVEEMVGMIAEKEHLRIGKNPGMFLLCNQQTQTVFAPDSSLADNQVNYGDTLLLV